VTFAVTYLKSQCLHLGIQILRNRQEKKRDGLEYGAGGRRWSTEKGIGDVCTTNRCALTIKRVTYVMIKRDAAFQMR